MRMLLVAALLVVVTFDVRADDLWYRHNANRRSVLAGPLFALRLSAPAGERFVVGVEGGVGKGPHRLNAGIDLRRFIYVEIDPWYLVGGTLGIGIDRDNNVQPVLGIWEGIPLQSAPCGNTDLRFAVTGAAGYRYTGEHDLYVTFKAGGLEAVKCGQ